MKTSEAREFLRAGHVALLNEEPTQAELRVLLVVGKHETNWTEAGQFKGSHNWGAIHCATKPPCPPDCFQGKDTLRGKLIKVCFRKYSDPFDGAVGFVDELFRKRPSVRAAANEKSWRAVAEAMRKTLYYVADPEERVRIFTDLDRELAAKLGEKPFASSGPSSSAKNGGSGWGFLLLLFALASRRR